MSPQDAYQNSAFDASTAVSAETILDRRVLGVGVTGVTGRDAIVHKRHRNISHKSCLPSTSTWFSAFLEAQLLRSVCAIVEHN